MTKTFSTSKNGLAPSGNSIQDAQDAVVDSHRAEAGEGIAGPELETEPLPLKVLEGQSADLETMKIYQQVLDSMVEGVSISEESGVIWYTNPAEDRMFGYEKGELIGKHVSVQNTYPPEENVRIVNEVIEQLKARGYWEGEFSNRKKDGTPFTTFARITAMEAGGKRYWVCVQEDVTERKRVEMEQQKSREQLRVILENVADGIMVQDPDRKIVYVNPAASRMMGYSSEQEILNIRNDQVITRFEIIDEDGKPLPASELPARYASQGRETAERVIGWRFLGSAEERWSVATARPVRDEHGQVQLAISIFRDITEQMRAEKALRRSERELTDFFENAALGLHWVGPDGTILRANQAELDLLGYTREEYIGHNIAEFHADEQVIGDILKRLTCGETLHNYEARLRCKDGSIKHVLISSNVLWEDDRFIHTRCFTRDITSRVRAEAALRESEARFRTMADTVPVMVWVSGPDMQRTYFNSYWLGFTGRTMDQELGYGWTDDLHPDDLQKYMELYTSSFRERTEFRIEYRLRRWDGKYRWVLSHGVPFFSPDGTFAGFIGSSMDITERIEIEERKDAFIALASHELKTPITSLKMNAQLLKRRSEKAGDTDLVQRLGKMDEQLSKLTDLVRSLLDASKIESGKLDYNFSEFPLEELLSESVEDMQQISEGHRIVFDGLDTSSSAASSVAIVADKDRLRQVLINLIANAVKFSPKAQEVCVGGKLEDGDGQVTVYVRDYGIGIARDQQYRIFDRFFQVGTSDSTRADTYPGLGLGLYISAEIVRRHGGQIWVESQVGKGSTFYFTLPLSGVLPEGQHDAGGPAPLRSDESSNGSNGTLGSGGQR
jgi:PAS domain S-box-containing protein